MSNRDNGRKKVKVEAFASLVFRQVSAVVGQKISPLTAEII